MPLSAPALITLAILGATILLLLTNVLRADLVALLVLISLGVTDVIAPGEVFSGFSRSAVITILAIFILTNGLYRTGVTHWLGKRLLYLSGQRPSRLPFVIMLAGAALSWFMNTIAAGAILLPAVVGLSRQTSVRTSKLLIPLSFSTLLGGMATLLTTANILVNTALRDAGYQPFGLLDFLPVGGSIAVAGVAFIALAGRWLLPEHARDEEYARLQPDPSTLSDLYRLQDRLYEAEIEGDSPLSGKSIAGSQIGETFGVSILAVVRERGQVVLAPRPEEALRAHDRVVILGRDERVQQLAELGVKVEPANEQETLASDSIDLVEVVVAPRSRVVGQTLKEIGFRQKFDLHVIALWRGGRVYRTDVGDIRLHFGDALLVHGLREKMRFLQSEPDFLVLMSDAVQPQRPVKGVLAALIMLSVLVTAAVGWLPIAEAAFAGAVLMVLTRCLTMDEAYQAVEWRAIFLIAGMLPLGLALYETGAGAYLGQTLIEILGERGPLAVLAGIYLLAMLLTQFVSGQATAVITTPVALGAAAQLGANPYAFAMAAALACSTAFMTPIAHPVNLLVMGPGGYSPRDFLRLGLPLSLICLAVLLLVLPVFWPL